MTPRRLILSTALALAFTVPASAETVAIVGARIETAGPKGALARGTLVITDGRIAAMGADVLPPAGAQVIDGTGKVVTPGLIAASTNLTASEVEGVRATHDDSAGAGLSAGFDISYGVNLASTFVPRARQTGVTLAVVTPAPLQGGEEDDEGEDGQEVLEARHLTAGAGEAGWRDPGLFGGQAAAVRLDEGDPDPVFKSRLAVTLDLLRGGPASSRGTAFVLLHTALADARRFARDPAAFDRDAAASRYGREDLEALVPVVQGRTPLLVRVQRAADIRQVLRFALAEHVHVILEGAQEAWEVAPELAEAGVAVLVDPEDDLPESFDTLGARLDNAARLQAAGVAVVIQGSRDFNNLRQARFNAGTAVAYGLPYEAAIASLTSVPARVFGFGDKAGLLEVGREADVVVWSGDPLETSSWPLAVFIAGKRQPDTSRGLQLRDRYLPQDIAAGTP
ncbi:amidohydrolase family protein [Caulobacter sp. S45]|uniref:amidohydrolase family protein n=1 Tax=Caulobacter sp. S45 TaxID=1641861 RepID=UPI0015771B8D|nr:amidohydrolase family protein [Caulobacter sp. S45]